MIDTERLLSYAPYELAHEQKHAFLTQELTELSRHHGESCPEYAKMLLATGTDLDQVQSFETLPFLPVRLFKEYALKSVPEESLHKTMTSSGTTGQQVSRIYLDRETSTLQSKVLSKIVGEFLGKQRLPMIILDTSAIVKNRAMFSARGAGILGFSIFGRDKMYALDENMQLDAEGLKAFLQKHEGEKIFLFGFTFMIWQHFCAQLRKLDWKPDLSRGVLVHGGGWKKLIDQNISTERFKQELHDTCGLEHVHDYYGMVEQTGTIYMECEHGHLHTPVWSDVTIRRGKDFSVADIGETGLIQVSSLLPRSYPGHMLLTEDEGRILGEDDCPCGRKGKYFEILGRIKRAEIRGCSDTYEQKPSA
ncbi:MAG: acyl-protein synthetase [Clostridiales bacterium]|nr:acyl-protein synthetase [Clostridiales bacterium]